MSEDYSEIPARLREFYDVYAKEGYRVESHRDRDYSYFAAINHDLGLRLIIIACEIGDERNAFEYAIGLDWLNYPQYKRSIQISTPQETQPAPKSWFSNPEDFAFPKWLE